MVLFINIIWGLSSYSFIGYLKAYSDAELDVSFKLGRLVYERMHEGVDKVVKNGMTSILFDSNTVPKKNKKCCYVLHDSEWVDIYIYNMKFQEMVLNFRGNKFLNFIFCSMYLINAYLSDVSFAKPILF